MLLYRCRECEKTYEEPDEYEDCMESYCGVSGMFSSLTYTTFYVCPHCGSFHDYESVVDEDEEDEY